MSTIAIHIYGGVWQGYFEELLSGEQEGVGNEGNGLLGEEITREEVV